jgi:hypothetical protein
LVDDESIPLTPGKCSGVELVDKQAFYPIHWQDWQRLFDEWSSDSVMRSVSHSYVVHSWNFHTGKVPIVLCSRQPLARLAHLHCPHACDNAGPAAKL